MADRDLRFDEELVGAFGAMVREALARHPELRSVAVTFDYHGPLNDAAVWHSVWLDRSGGVPEAPDAVAGSLFTTLRLAESQLARCVEVAASLRDELTANVRALLEGAPDVPRPADDDKEGAGGGDAQGDNERPTV